jgi:hypothetical protein
MDVALKVLMLEGGVIPTSSVRQEQLTSFVNVDTSDCIDYV